MRNLTLALILLALLAPVVDAQIPSTVECASQCYGEEINASATSDAICYEICGRRCGARAGFAEDCGTQCDGDHYCFLDPLRLWSGSGRDNLRDGCIAACGQRCDLNSLIIGPSGVVSIIRYGALLVAAIIFAICGLKLLLSDEPDKRTEAKNCLFYVMAGILIVGLATLIPEALMIPAGVVEPRLACSTCDECNSAIQAATAGELVVLTADINDHAGACIIIDSSDQIRFTCNGHVIDGTGGGIGISISDHRKNRVSNCEIKDFNFGIALSNSDDNTLSYNTVNSNGNNGIQLSSSGDNKIIQNTVNSNGLDGILLTSDSNNNEINGNTIKSNGFVGIGLDSSGNNKIIHNTVNSNLEGVAITDGSNNNQVDHNEVCDNPTFDIEVSADSTGNTGDKNKCNNVDNWRDTGEIIDRCTSVCEEPCTGTCTEPTLPDDVQDAVTAVGNPAINEDLINNILEKESNKEHCVGETVLKSPVYDPKDPYRDPIGIMQITSKAAVDAGFTPRDRCDGSKNILVGTTYLDEMSKEFTADIQVAVAAYNCGPGRATNDCDDAGKEPDECLWGDIKNRVPEETCKYVEIIFGRDPSSCP